MPTGAQLSNVTNRPSKPTNVRQPNKSSLVALRANLDAAPAQEKRAAAAPLAKKAAAEAAVRGRTAARGHSANPNSEAAIRARVKAEMAAESAHCRAKTLAEYEEKEAAEEAARAERQRELDEERERRRRAADEAREIMRMEALALEEAVVAEAAARGPQPEDEVKAEAAAWVADALEKVNESHAEAVERLMRERTERKAQSDADLAVLRSRVDARKHDKARFGPVPLAPMRSAEAKSLFTWDSSLVDAKAAAAGRPGAGSDAAEAGPAGGSAAAPKAGSAAARSAWDWVNKS